MTNIKKRISETLKWKKHPSYCAAKLNITEKQYIKLKKQVLYEKRQNKKKRNYLHDISQDVNVTEAIDLENGTGKLSGTFDYEPKSAEEIISDTFINPKFSAVKPLDILNTFKKYNIDLYSSFPDLKDIETFINTEHMQFKLTNNKSKKLFNKNSIHLHDFQSLSLNKNKNNKDVIKKIKKINQLKDLLVEKINDKNFNNYKIDIQKYLLNLNKFKKESKEFKKINIFDKKHNDEFIDEVKKVLNIMLEKKENEIKIKMLKKTIHKMKLLFKGYNGVGMNYYVGYRIK